MGETREIVKAEDLEKFLSPDTMFKVLAGDISALDGKQKVEYVLGVCKSLGLNPATKPFEFMNLKGKLTLYAKKDAAEQLRKIHGVSLRIVAREIMDDIYIVTASATDSQGKVDESTGCVSIANLRGEDKANAMMKAETKAKRRVTLSICGLGMLDETEVESIPGAFKEAVPATPKPLKRAPAPVEVVNETTGEVVDPEPPPPEVMDAHYEEMPPEDILPGEEAVTELPDWTYLKEEGKKPGMRERIEAYSMKKYGIPVTQVNESQLAEIASKVRNMAKLATPATPPAHPAPKTIDTMTGEELQTHLFDTVFSDDKLVAQLNNWTQNKYKKNYNELTDLLELREAAKYAEKLATAMNTPAPAPKRGRPPKEGA